MANTRKYPAAGHPFEIVVDPDRDLLDAVKLLSTHELGVSRSMVAAADRQTYVFAHAFLRLLLSARLDRLPSSLVFRRGAFGKPALCEPMANLHFSLSYRRNTIAIALADGTVGIDIEEMRPGIKIEDIIRRMFMLREQEFLLGLPALDRRQEFFRLWARKEALVKASGLGISDCLAVDSLVDQLHMQDDAGVGRMFGVKTLNAPSGYSLALAWAF